MTEWSALRKQFCLQRKKVNIDAKNEIGLVLLMADCTSYILVREVTLGSRARRFDRPEHEHFFSCLNARQVNR